jgi:glycosyltransferase involved in cell wall biosynthesis
MKVNPLVSILINSHNHENFIREAIDSALAQTYPNIEVIVVDDGSTDKTYEIICSYGSQIKAISKENAGQASAFNVGFFESKGDIICFLDSDDVFHKEKVQQVIDIFNTYSDISWCFHSLILVHKITGKLLGQHREINSKLCDFRQDIKKGRLPFYPPPSSCLCFKRELLNQILPMKQTFLKTSADSYIRLLAFALAQGFFLDQPLTFQGIHDQNAETLRQDKEALVEAKIMIFVYLMRCEFPQFKNIANRLFSRGFSYYFRYGNQWGDIKENYQEFVDKYLALTSLWEKIMIIIMTMIYCRPWRKNYTPRDVISVISNQ